MSLILAPLSAAALAQAPGPLPICGQAKPTPAEASENAKLKRLDKLPQAEAYLTVMRTENGCIRPAKVREERARVR
ncbi:hypothetical protein ACFSCW_05890 [Sphingomonas tabacisoli]|uniref:Uncharacterized protein n=1 Tax=Sphingomonas tabacisoli TaxID=2249466 RepID=A0ABW4I2L1_9SPHN